MNLEDHVGDIVRKARQMMNVSAAAAARAAGLSESELATFEESGKAPHSPNYAALAPLLDLAPHKLEQIGNGWVPTSRDLATWRELRSITTSGGGMSVNCYLIWDEVSREAALFDTGL